MKFSKWLFMICSILSIIEFGLASSHTKMQKPPFIPVGPSMTSHNRYAKESIETTKFYVCQKNKITYIKAEMHEGKIIIYDYKRDTSLSRRKEYSEEFVTTTKNEATAFIRKTINAFDEICRNSVGKKLVDRLCHYINPSNLPRSASRLSATDDIMEDSGPIVVFPYDFIGYTKSKDELPSITDKNFFPKEIAMRLPIDDKDSEASRCENFYSLLHYAPCFVAKEKNNKPFNMVLLKYSDEMSKESMLGIRQNLNKKVGNNKLIKLSKIPFSDDIIVFHEFNHARHFIEKVGIHDETTNAYENESSLGIEVRKNDGKGIERKYIMYSPEEELQLTGYTVVLEGKGNGWKKQRRPIMDDINEINYRICANKPIRFPYRDIRDRDTHDCYILNASLRVLINVACCTL